MGLQSAGDMIDSLDLRSYAKKAVSLGLLKEKDVGDAMAEYQHFLLLVYINWQGGNTLPVVPTERADKIWHQHILDTRPYRMFSMALLGRYLDHNPGLEKGTKPFDEAVKHTRSVHEAVPQGHGYVPVIFAGCSAACDSKGSSPNSCASGCGSSCASCGAGCGS